MREVCVHFFREEEKQNEDSEEEVEEVDEEEEEADTAALGDELAVEERRIERHARVGARWKAHRRQPAHVKVAVDGEGALCAEHEQHATDEEGGGGVRRRPRVG